MQVTRAVIVAMSLMLCLCAQQAGAQTEMPAPMVVPPPPPPPIVIPKTPVLGESAATPAPLPPPREPYSQRVRRCLDEGARAGLGPNEISAYSGRCVGQ